MSKNSLTLPDMSQLSASGVDFINEPYFESLLHQAPDFGKIREIIAKSMNKEALTIEETAMLLSSNDAEVKEQIFEAARQLKRDVYGNRIVLFAPLYVGNYCMNDCVYCGFRRSNKASVRRTLTTAELHEQVTNLLRMGHKRTIAVFGEHINYGPVFIANCVKEIYSVRHGLDSIRRVNINASPLSHEGYRIVKEVGIGTYQVFQETYHHSTYARMHPAGTRKSNFAWRLDAPARAIESGCDDVGLGALFGLADWRFEVLSLVAHATHLMQNYGVGPHTISFPRIRPASGVTLKEVTDNDVSDADFLRLIAILRLSVPYTGLIVTAREPAALRKVALGFGVSQIDAGSHIEIGGYENIENIENNENNEIKDVQVQALEREQFELGDIRPLDEVILQLLRDGYVPSFCTACYRLGRTGKVFMEYAIPGFIQNMCTPNALTTLKEYLVDHAQSETKEIGEKILQDELNKITDNAKKLEIIKRIERINNSTDRDLYF
ncbi:MAG: [FeFe] hydrogenase H-cluster radical SAM maturase HydG [Planctomycetaceae bacterium]|jgi:2-iminoacetate synthase|nr:[FeFe] hydrogenase H-cluster radical SAM maturase HydG [Planctomycetaceae bacterium]